jgi:hypothetical protein
VYVHDFFVIPEIVKSGNFVPEKGLLDKKTKDFIHAHLCYRYMVFRTNDSSRIVRDLETTIQRGVIETTNEAIINSILKAETVVGINGNTRHAIPIDEIIPILEQSRATIR